MVRAAALLAAVLALVPLQARPDDAPPASGRPTTVTPTYLYDLAALDGPIPMSWALLAYDRAQRELFVIAPAEGVRVFNRNGVEVFRFGDDGELGWVRGIAVVENGDLLLLSERNGARVLRTDFRGSLLGEVRYAVPGTLGAFAPTRIAYRGGQVYLADTARLKLLVTDLQGVTTRAVDLAQVAFEGKAVTGEEIHGFSVDERGNVLFTIPTQFRAYIVAPDGKVRSFGQRGSRPGLFNIVGPIVADYDGYVYVADTLRCVVMVFSPELEFLTEFGGRGELPGSMVAPSDLVIANDMLFVSQGGNRGVSVFLVRRS